MGVYFPFGKTSPHLCGLFYFGKWIPYFWWWQKSEKHQLINMENIMVNGAPSTWQQPHKNGIFESYFHSICGVFFFDDRVENIIGSTQGWIRIHDGACTMGTHVSFIFICYFTHIFGVYCKAFIFPWVLGSKGMEYFATLPTWTSWIFSCR